jgi:plasmid stabilization system protein ParE
MPANLIWRSQAREDLLLIYEFVGLDNPAAAERLFAAIENKTTLLIHHPRIGPRRLPLRFLVLRRFNILSRVPLSEWPGNPYKPWGGKINFRQNEPFCRELKLCRDWFSVFNARRCARVCVNKVARM